MKKIIVFLMALVMLLSLAACKKAEQEPTNTTAGTTTEPSTETTTAPQTTGESPSAMLQRVFKANVGTNRDVEALAQALITTEGIPFMGMSMAVEPGFLNGFSNEIDGFKKGATFGPMIGSIPYIGYVFELESEADVADFVQKLKDNADLRWNICVEADEMIVETDGNLVLFAMCPAEFAS